MQAVSEEEMSLKYLETLELVFYRIPPMPGASLEHRIKGHISTYAEIWKGEERRERRRDDKIKNEFQRKVVVRIFFLVYRIIWRV